MAAAIESAAALAAPHLKEAGESPPAEQSHVMTPRSPHASLQLAKHGDTFSRGTVVDPTGATGGLGVKTTAAGIGVRATPAHVFVSTLPEPSHRHCRD